MNTKTKESDVRKTLRILEDVSKYETSEKIRSLYHYLDYLKILEETPKTRDQRDRVSSLLWSLQTITDQIMSPDTIQRETVSDCLETISLFQKDERARLSDPSLFQSDYVITSRIFLSGLKITIESLTRLSFSVLSLWSLDSQTVSLTARDPEIIEILIGLTLSLLMSQNGAKHNDPK